MSAHALILLFLGCGGSGSPISASSRSALAGTYVLDTVDGLPVPTSFTSSGTTEEFTADTLIIGADNTWRDVPVIRITFSGVSTPRPARSGVIMASDSSITLLSEGTTAFAGRIIKDRLTLSDPTFVYVYHR